MNMVEEKKKFNRKLYPIYKMFSWDLLFYYAISFLFLTKVKGFSSSEVVLLDVSIYTLFRGLSQLPSTILTDKLGKRMSLIVGNIFLSFSILFILQCVTMPVLVIAELCMAFGFSMKSIAEPNILYDSLDEKKHFSKIDGKGSAFYYYLNAASSLATGFLYAINPYIPVIVCLMFCVIATAMSSFFYSLREEKEKPEKARERIKEYSSELRYVFKHIIKSSRLRYLIIFYAIFQSLIAVATTLSRSLLSDLNIPAEYFGIIFAVLSILSGASSYFQNVFHKKFRNRVLTVFSISYVISCLVSGSFAIMNVPFALAITFILLSFGVRASIKGPFYTLYKQYLGNFAGTRCKNKNLFSYIFS